MDPDVKLDDGWKRQESMERRISTITLDTIAPSADESQTRLFSSSTPPSFCVSLTLRRLKAKLNANKQKQKVKYMQQLPRGASNTSKLHTRALRPVI